jgi:hypothetical protein
MTKEHESARRIPRVLTMGALAVGLVGGSYGVAAAANSSPSTTGGTAVNDRPNHNGWGPQRSDEQPLTGDALAGVKQAALGRVAGSTIVRVETDADGNAAYEAHLIRTDGTPATVYVDKQFNVVSVESR